MNRVVVEETLRRHVTNGAYLAFLGLVAMFGLLASAMTRTPSFWPSLVTALAIAAGAGVIGPEFSSGTLQLVLVKPVNRAVYLLSRVAGVVLAVWIAALVGAASEIIGRLAWSGRAIPWTELGAMLLNGMADTLLTVALLALLGSLTRAYFNAAIYFAAMIGLSGATALLAAVRMSQSALGQMLARFPILERSIEVTAANLFPDVLPRFDRQWLLMVLSNAAVALVLACFAFRRREVPYGAD